MFDINTPVKYHEDKVDVLKELGTAVMAAIAIGAIIGLVIVYSV